LPDLQGAAELEDADREDQHDGQRQRCFDEGLSALTGKPSDERAL
jgi:hypothetical protein